MGKDRIYYLLQRYRDNLASTEEVRELFQRLETDEGQAGLKELLAEDWQGPDEREGVAHGAVEGVDWDTMLAEIRRSAVVAEKGKLVYLRKMRVAAALLLLIGGATLYRILASRRVQVAAPPMVSSVTPIVPGGNKAMLTLGDGTTIVLDSARNGMLAQQGNSKVVKMYSGVLAYDAHSRKEESVLFNTIATPYGGQYQVVLPDGSKVWLNAASSLRFPTAFEGKERRVELSGEGYFEVARDASKPFMVHVIDASGGAGTDVQVLGTSFDIMAYGNEERSSTTLVSGKVRVAQPGGSGGFVEPEPGRQAIVDRRTHVLSVADANVDQVIAWKNGLFRFHETGIRELMRQVERWYNVQVEYKTDGNDQDFTGIVSRSKDIDELLHTLEMTQSVHFQIEGRKVIVLP